MCVIEVFSKYARVTPLKGKNDETVTKTFQIFFKKLNCKSNKISIKSCFHDNNIDIFSVHDKLKSVVTEKFTRILNNEIMHITIKLQELAKKKQQQYS